MNVRATGREIRAGLMVVLAMAALVVLLGLAGGGTGFLTHRRQIDVDFRDGQGLRAGAQVRIAGVESGRVVGVTLAEVDGVLRARVRLAVPDDLAARLKADARITIQSSLTGQSRVNIISIGQSTAPLPPGEILQGVETTMFDPILEQVGLGPIERSHLSHTIGEVRELVDVAAPKVRRIVGAVEETTDGIKATSDAVRPVVESAVGHVDELTRKIAAASPKLEAVLGQVVTLTARVDSLLAENRPNLDQTIVSLRDLSATLKMVVARDQEKVSALIDHVDTTRLRADQALYNVKQITDVAMTMLARNKVDIERTVSNLKDASDWGSKLVQKIYANPFVISPLYKPKPEDIRVQGIFDAMQVFSVGCEKLDDAVKTLEVMQARPATPQQKQEMELVRRQVSEVTGRLNEMSAQLTEAMKGPSTTRIRRGSAN
ncbi:MlaD family protein [Tundrisphaera lichenicola]|uniref:MlaD family protein n=1 Tax=Tundrisphaera lichenicola TaxID=2029860 RepID=UPI003EBC1845